MNMCKSSENPNSCLVLFVSMAILDFILDIESTMDKKNTLCIMKDEKKRRSDSDNYDEKS